MSVRDQLDEKGQGQNRYDPALPTGYEWKKQRRYVLSGGGYTRLCCRPNLLLDLFNPVAQFTQWQPFILPQDTTDFERDCRLIMSLV
jgi:hypothetical protein